MLGRDAATQTWCVVGSINDADIVPGYRVYASTLDTNAYCCRAHGLYNVSANTCVVKTCDTNHPHVYTSFLHINHVVGQHVYDCYALYVFRGAPSFETTSDTAARGLCA